MQNSLIQLLKSAKADSSFGGLSASAVEARRRILLSKIGASDVTRPVYGLREYAAYVSHALSFELFKPMAVGLTALVVVFSGWAYTLNAAFGSLPGDALYPIKLASERVQLGFASDRDTRTLLRAEFAGRRIDEVVAVASTPNAETSARVKTAVDGFKKEIASVKQNLSTSTPETVKAVDRKAAGYRAAISTTKPLAPSETKDEIQKAETAIEDTTTEVVEVIITKTERSTDQKETRELQTRFDREVADVLAQAALFKMDQEIKPALNDARKLFADGAFRQAFALVKEQRLLVESARELQEQAELEEEAQREEKESVILNEVKDLRIDSSLRSE